MSVPHDDPPSPIPVILDTDIWGDIDDVLALAALHALQDRGEVQILAITCSMTDKSSMRFIDMLNTFYGHGDIPVGLVSSGVEPPPTWRGDGAQMQERAAMYTEYITSLRNQNGNSLFPCTLPFENDYIDSVTLLRQTLVKAQDNSVAVIGVGFFTNLSRLLDSEPDQISSLRGSELVRHKVRFLSSMSCMFEDARYGTELVSRAKSEYNIRHDIPSARAVFDRWPRPIYICPFELGFSLRVQGGDIARSFNYIADHPVQLTYRYMDETYRHSGTTTGELHDHKTMDLMAVLYAGRSTWGYFSRTDVGKVHISSDGISSFERSVDGSVRIVRIAEGQHLRSLEAMTMLLSQPPRLV